MIKNKKERVEDFYFYNSDMLRKAKTKIPPMTVLSF